MRNYFILLFFLSGFVEMHAAVFCDIVVSRTRHSKWPKNEKNELFGFSLYVDDIAYTDDGTCFRASSVIERVCTTLLDEANDQENYLFTPWYKKIAEYLQKAYIIKDDDSLIYSSAYGVMINSIQNISEFDGRFPTKQNIFIIIPGGNPDTWGKQILEKQLFQQKDLDLLLKEKEQETQRRVKLILGRILISSSILFGLLGYVLYRRLKSKPE